MNNETETEETEGTFVPKVPLEEGMIKTESELKTRKKRRGRPKRKKTVHVQESKNMKEQKEEIVNKPKQFVFRSKDRFLRLVWKSSYTRKERGESEFFPSKGVQFNDWQLIINSTPENKKILDKLFNHPSRDVKFKLEPSKALMAVSPKETLEQLEKMSEEELQERCRKVDVIVTPDMSKERMIIELTKVLTQ